MNTKEILKLEIKLLTSFSPVQAYTGTLDNLIQKSYVEYGEIIKVLNEKRKELKDLEDAK